MRHEEKTYAKTVISWRESEFIKSGDNTNTLMIERVRQKVTLGINGHIVATEKACDLKPGYVGLFVRVFKDDFYAEARFRNFVLYFLAYLRIDIYTKEKVTKSQLEYYLKAWQELMPKYADYLRTGRL